MRKRPRILGGVIVSVASALILAACGSSSTSSSSDSAAVQGKTVTIGLSSILSGPYAVYGQVGQGIQAYLETANANGGINGYKFKVQVKDNQYQSSQAIAINRGFAQSGVLAIFDLGTPASQAALDLANELRIPQIAAANGDLFTPSPSKYAYTVDAPFSGLGLFEAQYIMQHLGTKQFALAYEDDDIGSPVDAVVPKYVQEHGGKLLTSLPVNATATDFSAAASRLKNSGAQVVQAFIGTTAFAGLQKAAAAIGYHPTWVTFFTQANPAYPALVGSLANGVYADNFLDTSGPALSAFQAAMKKYYPKLISAQFAQLGWSQAAILTEGIKKATQGGAKLTTDSLTQALESLTGVSAGFLPSVSFSAQTHAAGTKDAMFKYTGSTLKQVTPYQDFPSIPQGVKPLS